MREPNTSRLDARHKLAGSLRPTIFVVNFRKVDPIHEWLDPFQFSKGFVDRLWLIRSRRDHFKERHRDRRVQYFLLQRHLPIACVVARPLPIFQL